MNSVLVVVVYYYYCTTKTNIAKNIIHSRNEYQGHNVELAIYY